MPTLTSAFASWRALVPTVFALAKALAFAAAAWS